MISDPLWGVIFGLGAWCALVVLVVASVGALHCLYAARDRPPGLSLGAQFLVEVRGVLKIRKRRARHGRGGGSR